MPPDARTLHDRAVRASARGRPAAAVRLLERALVTVDDEELHVRVLVTLAHAAAETGHLGAGLAHLDAAAARLDRVTAGTRGRWHGQRGLLLLRAGDQQAAAADLDAAADLLAADPTEHARVLLNRGVLHLRQSALDRAQADFRRCREVADAAGLALLLAKATANEGYVAYLRGDLPRAIALLDAADDGLGALAPGARAVNVKDRAEALSAASLLDDAHEQLRHAVRLLRSSELLQDRAEAELSLSQVALRRGHVAEARRWARRAAEHFARRGARGWTLVAELQLAQADLARVPLDVAAATERLEPQLRAHGLVEEAAVARLVHAAALVRAGQVDAARERLGRRTPPAATIGTRLLAHETRAAALGAAGDVLGAQRVRRRGLTELAAYQSRFGSLDLVTAAGGIGARLAEDGLAEAVRGGRPADVLDWSERVRATSSRITPVRPEVDGEHSAWLARLRQLRAAERAARLAGRPPAAALRSEIRSLESAVRQRSWHRSGSLRVSRPVGLGALREALGDDGALVTLISVRGTVHALTVTRRSAVVRPVADVRAVRESVLRVRADLDALATHVLPSALRTAVSSSLRTGLRSFETLLAAALDGVDPGGPVAVVPSGLSAQVPWPLLTRLRGRPVCVVPSATWWLRARSQDGEGGGRVVLVAGPDVLRAAAEVQAVEARTPGAVVLRGEAATTSAVLAAADGADVLHVAAHGRHVADNPLFSSLLLADGWLFGHDLDALRALPRHVVLSACETGMASMRPGDEALGMTAALLHGGARSVVASVARVGDGVAEGVAVAHHAGLRSGATPAAALAVALAEVPDGDVAPAVCFGAGW